MFRVRPEEGAISGPKWEFTGGDPLHGVLPTVVSAAWLSDVQNEIVNAVEASGQELAQNDQMQLHKAILRGGARGADEIVVGPGGHFQTLQEAVAVAGPRSSILVMATQTILAAIAIREEFISIKFRWGKTVVRGGPDIHNVFSVYANGFRLEDLHVTDFKYLIWCDNPPPTFAFIRNSTVKDGSGAVMGTTPSFLDLSSFINY